jgi:hypothetical protein
VICITTARVMAGAGARDEPITRQSRTPPQGRTPRDGLPGTDSQGRTPRDGPFGTDPGRTPKGLASAASSRDVDARLQVCGDLPTSRGGSTRRMPDAALLSTRIASLIVAHKPVSTLHLSEIVWVLPDSWRTRPLRAGNCAGWVGWHRCVRPPEPPCVPSSASAVPPPHVSATRQCCSLLRIPVMEPSSSSPRRQPGAGGRRTCSRCPWRTTST